MDVSRSEVTHSYFQVYYFMNYVNGKARLRCIHNIKSKTILYLGLFAMVKVKLGLESGPVTGPWMVITGFTSISEVLKRNSGVENIVF